MTAKTSGNSILLCFFPSISNLVSINVTVIICFLFWNESFFSFQADFFTLLMCGRSGFKFDDEDNYR